MFEEIRTGMQMFLAWIMTGYTPSHVIQNGEEFAKYWHALVRADHILDVAEVVVPEVICMILVLKVVDIIMTKMGSKED